MDINNTQLTEDKLNEDEIKSRIIIVNIKILGELKNGVKLNTREKHFALDDVGFLQAFKRLYRVDSRESTYEKISELVKDVQELFNRSKILDMEKDEFIKYIIKDLIKAKKGLLSLKDTYSEDKTFISQIDIEISALGRLIDKNVVEQQTQNQNIQNIQNYQTTEQSEQTNYNFGNNFGYKDENNTYKWT